MVDAVKLKMSFCMFIRDFIIVLKIKDCVWFTSCSYGQPLNSCISELSSIRVHFSFIQVFKMWLAGDKTQYTISASAVGH